MSCCDINPSYFSISDLNIEIGDLDQSPPMPLLAETLPKSSGIALKKGPFKNS
jgi:hypothetical protein